MKRLLAQKQTEWFPIFKSFNFSTATFATASEMLWLLIDPPVKQKTIRNVKNFHRRIIRFKPIIVSTLKLHKLERLFIMRRFEFQAYMRDKKLKSFGQNPRENIFWLAKD